MTDTNKTDHELRAEAIITHIEAAMKEQPMAQVDPLCVIALLKWVATGERIVTSEEVATTRAEAVRSYLRGGGGFTTLFFHVLKVDKTNRQVSDAIASALVDVRGVSESPLGTVQRLVRCYKAIHHGDRPAVFDKSTPDDAIYSLRTWLYSIGLGCTVDAPPLVLGWREKTETPQP